MARRQLGLFPLFHRRNLLAFAKKAFWMGMLVLHLGAIRSAAPTVFSSPDVASPPDGGLRLFALSIAAIFFALKFADVPWLRLKRGWRSAIASLVIVALLHVNAVQRLAAGERMSSPTPLSALLFVAVLVDVGAVRRQGLHLWNAVVRASTNRARRRGRQSYPCDAAWPEAAIPPHSWLARGLLAPRPPPLA